VSELLDKLLEVLGRIDSLTATGRERFLEDDLVSLSVERLWILAGNLAEAYRMAEGLAITSEPWSELYAYRNLLAHALPGQVTPGRVWQESVDDLPRLSETVRQAGATSHDLGP
jgi:uncharacterized protein with HEPN domain